jgi:hypothetical protein
MDHQPLNTGEQKDMAEFFIDLVSKLEEMTPELKNLVKTLFGGVISNNVVSLVSDLYADMAVAVLSMFSWYVSIHSCGALCAGLQIVVQFCFIMWIYSQL